MSENDQQVELLILGGGCAGLSLARQLAVLENEGHRIPETHIIEARKVYDDRQTWCFWEADDDGDVGSTLPVHRSWERWSFETRNGICAQSAEPWRYYCLPSRPFFDQCVDWIGRSEAITLHRGLSVQRDSIRVVNGTYQIATSRGVFLADHVICTLPDPPSENPPECYQLFAGAEIEMLDGEPHGIENPQIMTHLRVDDLSFIFDYLIPMDDRRVLIEPTRFSSALLDASQLDVDLQKALSHYFPRRRFQILRTEAGCLPMGFQHERAQSSSSFNWIDAGIPGGALRPATGYGFRRIQKWARESAMSWVRERKLRKPDPVPPKIAGMDQLFLKVLRKHPHLAPDCFYRLFERVEPSALIRFLSEEASVVDLIQVMRALPATPFLKQWIRGV